MENIIVNLFVVGFHHKRGCEIEFVYPPCEDFELKSNVSEIWKNLCSIALPDGAHKINSDVFHFVVPGNDKNKPSVLFGISCFKQISSENIKNKSEDITRNTIQKSVVVLSSQPFFHSIGSLLHGITENYFDIGDFNKRDILVESFHQLNEHFRLVLEDKTNNEISSLIDQGFSLSDLILRYEHNIFILIKLIMLRRKIIFFIEPISKLTSTILCLISLFSGEYKSSKFQETMKYIDDFTEDDIVNNSKIKSNEEIDLFESNVNLSSNDSDKSSSNNENKLPTGTSLFQNIKSGGGQAIKALSSFAVSNIVRSSDSDNNAKPSQSDDLSAPLPPFIDKVGYVPDNNKSDFNNLRDSWGFPLGIFDERNIFLPYASLGYLNVLDNNKIHSFVIGASNHLWKMKFSKIDVIINEDNKAGGIEYCNKDINNTNKKSDELLQKLIQLTVLDRRLADYLLTVVKVHNSSNLKKSNSTASMSQVMFTKADHSYSDLSIIDIGEDTLNMRISDTDLEHNFSDQKSLDEWLRQVLIDYIRAISLSAASWGTRQSFSDFGWDFMLAIQQQNYFKEWFYSVDKHKLVQESKYSFNSFVNSDSVLSLNLSVHNNKDNSESEYNKMNIIMSYDHPGRFVPVKFGDNIPGYYQFKEYAGQSRAIVNRGVTEIKKFGTETSSQLKSSMSAGFSKISVMAKVHSSKWWQSDSKIFNKSDESNKVKQ